MQYKSFKYFEDNVVADIPFKEKTDFLISILKNFSEDEISSKLKIKGKIWNYICLTEYDEQLKNIIDCKAIKIDWKIIKEDTFYILQWWEFMEFID